MNLLVAVLFFASGSLALVYQVAWVRMLTLQLGSTSLAVSTVLTMFMGGLALGARAAGARADSLVRPLRTYGVLEVVLAAYAGASPWLFPAVFPLFDRVAIGGSFLAVSLARAAVVGVLVLPPAILMGATLPVLVRDRVLRTGEGRAGAGHLYGVNTLGACAGTLLAGFVLLPGVGLRRTLLHASLANAALGLVAVLAGGRALAGGAREAHPGRDRAGAAPRAVLAAVALAGFAGMVCEVVWTRVLVLVLGASVHAFTVVLGIFLVGLGAGAVVAAAALREAPGRAPALFQGAALLGAAGIGVSAATFGALPEAFRYLYLAWDMEANPGALLPAQFLLAAVVMLPPVVAMGMLFPVALADVLEDPAASGRATGRLYAWNTLGSIAGSFAAGFVLVPAVGIRTTLLLAAGAQCAAAALVAIEDRGAERGQAGVVLAAAVLATLATATPTWNRQLMTSGMHQYADVYGGLGDLGEEGLIGELRATERLVYYRDGLTSTITVVQGLTGNPPELSICTNGKIDGSSRSDMPTQRLSAHVPLLVHPDPKEVCVIGLGTGCTSGSAALHPGVREVVTVEIEEAMVEGARFFREHNHAVHENPRAPIRVTDGRLFLRTRPGAFDVVVSEPSNPWLAGSSDLFTTDFFRLGARALRPGGLFCQWVQLYGMSPASTRTIVRGFREVFPQTFVVSSIPGADLLLLGSRSPVEFDLARMASRLRGPVGRDLSDPRVGIRSVAELIARVRLGPGVLDAYVGDGPLHTDDLPVLAYTAVRDRYRATRDENDELIEAHAGGVAPHITNLPPPGPAREAFLRALRNALRDYVRMTRE